MGYAGGTKESPTYRDLGDHTEMLQIDFDPTVVGYDDLLALFWANHAPTQPAWSPQYRSLVIAHDDEQHRLATARKRVGEEERGKKLHTEIVPKRPFYLAEDYHQKYYLRRVELLTREIEQMYPAGDGLVVSTAASRLNGYLGGHGLANLDRERDRLGLSELAVESLTARVRRT